MRTDVRTIQNTGMKKINSSVQSNMSFNKFFHLSRLKRRWSLPTRRRTLVCQWFLRLKRFANIIFYSAQRLLSTLRKNMAVKTKLRSTVIYDIAAPNANW